MRLNLLICSVNTLLRHHRSFNQPRRAPPSYGFASIEGTPWRSKHEFFPGGGAGDAAAASSSSSSVRRQHSARRVLSSPVVAGGGFHVHMDSSAALAASFGHRYTTRRAMIPPPPPPPNMVFERSRDDFSLEKSSPLRDLQQQQLQRPFSFAGALRSEGPPSSLLKESLIRGAASAGAAGLARSHSQLHRSVWSRFV